MLGHVPMCPAVLVMCLCAATYLLCPRRYGSNALRATALNSRLREDDLPAMAYRIYLSGSNTASRPWFLEVRQLLVRSS